MILIYFRVQLLANNYYYLYINTFDSFKISMSLSLVEFLKYLYSQSIRPLAILVQQY